MQFELNDYHRNISDEEIIADVQAVAQMDYDYIVDFFYGQGTMDLMEIKSLDEALDKALLIEKLKKIYSLASNYNINWNSGTNVLPATNEMIMKFFRKIC